MYGLPENPVTDAVQVAKDRLDLSSLFMGAMVLGVAFLIFRRR